MELWIARDKFGVLMLYTVEPIKNDNWGEFMILRGCGIVLSPHEFPNITWENSPQLVELKIKDNGILDS